MHKRVHFQFLVDFFFYTNSNSCTLVTLPMKICLWLWNMESVTSPKWPYLDGSFISLPVPTASDSSFSLQAILSFCILLLLRLTFSCTQAYGPKSIFFSVCGQLFHNDVIISLLRTSFEMLQSRCVRDIFGVSPNLVWVGGGAGSQQTGGFKSVSNSSRVERCERALKADWFRRAS